MTDLSQLPPGTHARITAVHGHDALSQRLLEMGVLEGDTVEVVAIAPFGDPLEIRLGGCRLSLRKAEAARVAVQVLNGEV